MPKKAEQRFPQGDTERQFPSISQKKGLDVLELRGRDIFQVEGVLTITESQAFVKAAENLGFQHQGSRGAAFGEAYRDNSRTSVNSQLLADQLWRNTGLNEVFQDYPMAGQQALGLNPNIRFYKQAVVPLVLYYNCFYRNCKLHIKYVAGNKFGKHIDEAVKAGQKETKYTLLIYLSGGRECGQAPQLLGGETLFYGGKRSKLLVSVAPQPGLALLHLHGDDCLEHEGAEVIQGVKYVLRSDVVYG